MKRTETVIIGAGQAGLAMSRCLVERGVPHVVLERGRIAERWRSERWDSARLLTPNWQSRLPYCHYRGSDPDGYMKMSEVVDYFESYAGSFAAPVETGTTVLSVEQPRRDVFVVTTDRGVWQTSNVVIATGHCDVPYIPPLARGLSDGIHQTVPTRYRNPDSLPAGGVLVVGASASGTQLASELVAAGRQVTLAVGRHTRLPRQYRGKDIPWWLEMSGKFREPIEPTDDGAARRFRPSTQLAGRTDRGNLDLGVLQARGVRLTGRAIAACGSIVRFADDLAESVARADDQLQKVLGQIDEFIETTGMSHRVGPRESIERIHPLRAPSEIDLSRERVTTVLWATGFRRNYAWLRIPVLDGDGEIRHRGGITPVAGLYLLGLQSMRRRNSSFIDGVGIDAEELASHLAARVRSRAA
ncbi:MAG TPA: NAD(P)-binding domain-containing protein [Candidatus Polarisedimenticolaceae bacterium]|nr:NAD(P)-binding domain-containing protein [Candidatus Polarisedimenticolaceae bacterium]